MPSADSKKAQPGSSSPTKKGPIIELKNGKVTCKQKPVSFEKQSETLQEIVKFREMLEARLDGNEGPLNEIPVELQPVIAKLAHESDKGLTAIAKHIRQELLPAQDDDDEDRAKRAAALLPPAVVESAITAILHRKNYGIDVPMGTKLPASLAVWRWEVREVHKDWLPKSARDKADARLEERKEAKRTLMAVFDALSEVEKQTILGGKGATVKASTPGASESDAKGKKRATEVVDVDDATTPKAVKVKKSEPKKPAKEKVTPKKPSNTSGIMAFFKAKPTTSTISPTKSASTASSSQSDFERVFKPFVLKKGATLAPINSFKAAKKKRSGEVIVIDDEDDDVQMVDSPALGEKALSQQTTQERLNNILSSLPAPRHPLPRRPLPYGFKVYQRTSIRDIMSQLSEAEVTGDDDLVRVLTAKLQDRKIFPAKALIFHEDARPGYYGTWTRSSKIIGPRRPLAQDTDTFDYGYDSGEEWEEEPAGEDVAADDEEDEVDDADSDADSWLVDDDDEPDINIKDLDDFDAPDIFGDNMPPPPTKRKAADGEKKSGKKRKVVVALQPFVKGPFWEESIGECSYDPFKPYRIEFFNDTPFPIDPFTYVSTCQEDYRDWRNGLNKPAASTTVSSDGFAVPLLPARLNGGTSALSTDNLTVPSTQPTSTTSINPTTAPPPPPAPKKALKTPFPDAHLPHLLDRITKQETGSFNLLVELIYEDLKGHKEKVTKAAIEAKIREVGEKVQKKWTVKSGWVGYSAARAGDGVVMNSVNVP